ncbi:MAG: AsmA family protein [Gammaproteobacteria bacterium]|nr:AsmA family protein [Gammaproteobacteria bacterium]
MRALKWIGVGVGALLLLLIVGLLLAVLFFDANAFRGRLQTLVHQHTGRELQLQGDLEVSVFPWLAVEFGPATLGNAAGFGREPMLALRHARLGLKLWPLLQGRFEVGSVRLAGPAVRLEVDAHGRDNWSDLLTSRTQAPGEGAAPARVPGSVASVTVSDGSLVYVDRRAAVTRKVSALGLRTGRIEPGKPFRLELQATVEPDARSRIDLTIDAQAQLQPVAQRYLFDAPAVTLRWHGAPWPKEGLPVALRLRQLAVDLDAQTLDAPGLQLLVAGASLSGDLKGERILDAPRISGPVRLADLAPRTLLGQLGIQAPATRDPQVLQHLSLAGQLNASSAALSLDGLQGKLDETTLAGRLGVDFDSGRLRFALQLDRLDADRYLAPPEPAPVPGGATAGGPAASAPAPIEIPVDLLRSLELQGELRAATARFAGIEYSGLRFGLNAHAGRVRIHPSEARLYGGAYRGDIVLDVSGAVPRASFDEHVSDVDFAALFKDLFDSGRFAGRGDASARLTASGRDTAAMLRTLGGDVAFDVRDGAVEGMDLWYEIRRARALFRRQDIPQRSGPERTPFTALRATGKVTRGVLANDDLVATTAYLKIRGRGTLDLAAATLDYRLDAEVPRSINALDRDAGDAADLAGLVIPVRLSGALADPKVRPDLEGLAKAEVKRQVEKKKEEVKEKVKEQLRDKLKGLLGG